MPQPTRAPVKVFTNIEKDGIDIAVLLCNPAAGGCTDITVFGQWLREQGRSGYRPVGTEKAKQYIGAKTLIGPNCFPIYATDANGQTAYRIDSNGGLGRAENPAEVKTFDAFFVLYEKNAEE